MSEKFYIKVALVAAFFILAKLIQRYLNKKTIRESKGIDREGILSVIDEYTLLIMKSSFDVSAVVKILEQIDFEIELDEIFKITETQKIQENSYFLSLLITKPANYHRDEDWSANITTGYILLKCDAISNEIRYYTEHNLEFESQLKLFPYQFNKYLEDFE